jgi:hypothetical protein
MGFWIGLLIGIAGGGAVGLLVGAGWMMWLHAPLRRARRGTTPHAWTLRC